MFQFFFLFLYSLSSSHSLLNGNYILSMHWEFARNDKSSSSTYLISAQQRVLSATKILNLWHWVLFICDVEDERHFHHQHHWEAGKFYFSESFSLSFFHLQLRVSERINIKLIVLILDDVLENCERESEKLLDGVILWWGINENKIIWRGKLIVGCWTIEVEGGYNIDDNFHDEKETKRLENICCMCCSFLFTINEKFCVSWTSPPLSKRRKKMLLLWKTFLPLLHNHRHIR